MLFLSVLRVCDFAPSFPNGCQSPLSVLPQQLRFRNGVCREVGLLWARLCFACVSWYVRTHRSIAYNFCFNWGANIGLNGLSDVRKLKMWGNTWLNIYFAKEYSNTQKTMVLFYFSKAFLTGMGALPLWWAMQPLLRASVKVIGFFSWIFSQRKKKKSCKR